MTKDKIFGILMVMKADDTVSFSETEETFMKRIGKRCLMMLLTVALLLGAGLSVAASAPSVHAEEGNYYAQLNDHAKLIYDALADPDNLILLMAGEPVTVGEPYTVTIPAKPSQEEYDALVDAFSAESNRMAGILSEMSNAAAAFDREHSEVFWTSGVYGHTELAQNGEATDGSISLSPGNTYTVSLKVGLYLVSDWDPAEQNARDLSNDIATLQQNVAAVAEAAKSFSHTRYGRLQKVNELLCLYNDYNTPAANGSHGYGHSYPWTPLSALDQLMRENDADGGLKPVCEGYARAFQLICNELEIPCVLVSGIGNDEEHMWAYVQMEDGIWYAMDVTWNDSLGRNDYFLVGRDVMDESHEPRGHFMSSGQTTVFHYPALSERAYDPNKLTLNPSKQTMMGGGTLTLTVGGALEGEVSLVCNRAGVSLIEVEEGVWITELPNETADYTFTATFEGEGVYHGVTAVCNVRTEQHTHAFGEWTDHNADLHRADCVCGESKTEAHAFGEWLVTKEATANVAGRRERTCVCGKKQTETIAPTGTNEDGANGSTQTPVGGADRPTVVDRISRLGGCFSAASGGAVVLCACFGALLIRRRRK